MVRQQRTIKNVFVFEGTGLHTGEKVRTVFHPAPPGTGIVFRRIDLDPVVEIPARADFIYSGAVKRNTTLSRNGAQIHTVEHLLAAATGMQVDNLVIEIDADEPPEPTDGSCLELVEALRAAGIENQGVPIRPLKITSPVTYYRDGVQLLAVPYDGFRISFTIEYDSEHIGTQYRSLDITPSVFASEIAPARTFALMSDVEMLRSEGLIKGGSLENAVVVDENGIMNDEPLRFPDEFVRHKMLDIIGDLTLVGTPVEGHVIAVRSGHNYNLPFAKLLAKDREAKERALPGPKEGHWDIGVIQNIMPHRYPFLLVDRIIEFEDRRRVVGIKNVTINEPFFSGHFPGHPIMPAVLIIEAMAQVGGILLLSSVDNPEKYLVYFIGIDKAKFRKPVLPGDQLRFELEMIAIKRRFCKMRGRAFVDGAVVAEAELSSTIIDR
ncbi:MAG: bifunctional UDP-3-O-[3-hydroxymyristoyl] N-acetylglucosamine deacetylase/3-hydroxyacyl-ACP dehydratase [Candidatus Krumholzibacteria bacterium]|nr:bifunctional UDP-3-O-[3-hydroxymyristoyl] N-acetylglucosamine deacetylase/3-hydroxyacyl-ACP dehydratase [Candidatus Krumholzibacteria bacterium]